MRFQPFRVVSQRTPLAQAVIHTVALDVSLIIDIKPIFITQFIETTVLRIMAQTHRVDIVALHQFQVLAHQFFAHVMTCQRIVFVHVHPFQFQRLSVDEQHMVVLAIGCLLINFLDFDTTETYVIRNDLSHLAVFLHRHQQFIQIRGFRGPRLYFRQFLAERHRTFFSRQHLGCLLATGYHLSFAVQ